MQVLESQRLSYEIIDSVSMVTGEGKMHTTLVIAAAFLCGELKIATGNQTSRFHLLTIVKHL